MEPKQGEGKIPKYGEQKPADIENIKKRNFELLEKGLSKKLKPEEQKEQVIELTREVEARHKIQPEKPKLSRLVDIEKFRKGGKIDMVKYGEALKEAKDKLEGKIKYVPTAAEQEIIKNIDKTLAEMEKGEVSKNFDEDIEAILKKIDQGE